MINSKLGEEKLSKVFIANVLPAIVAMVINGSQSIIDGLFLGNFNGAYAMASINIIQPFMQLIFATSFVICTGAISLIGRSLGSGNIEKAQSVFRTSALTTTIIAIIITILGSSCSRYIATMLGATELLVENSSLYIFVISFFAPVINNMYLFGFADRTIDKPNQYLYGAVASVIANILLDYIFIALLHMGVLGASLATGISYLVALIVNAIPVLKKKNIINLFTGKIKFKLMLPVSANGSSEAVVCGSTAISVFLFNTALKGIAQEAGIAAFTIINYISTFGTLAMFGISDGINAVVSYNYGSNKMDRVRKTYFTALVCNFVIGIIVFMIVYLAGESLITMFSKNPAEEAEIIDMAFHGAKIYAFAFFMVGFNIVSSGFFTAIGGALSSVVIAASRGIIWVVVGIVTFPRFLGIDGVWITMPFAEACTVIVTLGAFLVKYLKDKKRKQKQQNLADKI